MSNYATHPITAHPLLSLRATAREFQLSVSTIRAAIECGDLPAYRIAGQRRLRILREDILAWLCMNPVEPKR